MTNSEAKTLGQLLGLPLIWVLSVIWGPASTVHYEGYVGNAFVEQDATYRGWGLKVIQVQTQAEPFGFGDVGEKATGDFWTLGLMLLGPDDKSVSREPLEPFQAREVAVAAWREAFEKHPDKRDELLKFIREHQ